MLVGLIVALVLASVACSDTEDAVDLHLAALGPGAVRIDGVERELPHRHRALRGSSVNLEAVPAAGHAFERWDDGIVATENPTSIVMDDPLTVRVVFVPIATDPDPNAPGPDPDPEPEPEPDPDRRILSIERTGSGQGTIVSDPTGVACGGTCAASFPQGSVVTLTAAPASGSSIADWSGCASIEGATCTLTLTDDITVTLRLDLLESPAPANAAFAARSAIGGANGTTAGSNVGATKEPGEPDHAGDPGGRSVWWSWTAPANGSVSFDVSHSGFDAVVAVYIGSTLAQLQVPTGGVEPSAAGDVVGLHAVAGSTYQVAVDGRAGASGSVHLTWSMASAPRTAEWVAEPSTLAYTGLRGGAQPETQSIELRNDWVGDGDGDADVGFSVSSDRSWLHVTPSTGSLEAGASASLEVSVGACSSTGAANGVLTVSGGGDTTTITVGRSCEGADWRATPSPISFVGEIDDASAFVESMTLRNAGNLAAAFDVSADGAAWLSVDPTSGHLGAGASTDLHVTASACNAVALESGTLVVTGGGHNATIAVSRDCRAPYVAPPIALSIDRVYVNQSVPGQDSSKPVGDRVPLVANRAGLLRVFATADEAGAGSAQARLHYRHGTGPEHTIVLSGPASVPTSTSEGSLSTTYDALLPASVLQPGLQGYVTLSASVGGESVDARHPPSGSWTFDVRTVPAADFTLVPVAYRGTTPPLGNGRDYLDITERVFPMANDTIDIQVGSPPLAFNGDLGTWQGWLDLLYDVTDRQLSDPAGRHHYGVVDPGYTSGIAGIAWVGGYRAAAGWSHLPSGSHVAAHELGHNWGLWHAPCGTAGDVDPAFPYPDGGIGVWGYDLVAAALRSPNQYADLMSYCQPAWVSDYHYQKVMDYRAAYGYSVHTAAADGPATPVLLVQGWIDAETVHLDPLLITTLRQRPTASGPYTFLGWDSAGTEVLRVPFDTLDLSLHGVRGFHLSVPLPDTNELTLARVRLEHHGQTVLERSLPVRTTAFTPTSVSPRADGRVTITWDTRTYDALMVRDGPDGILLGRDSSGQFEVWPTRAVLELLFSDGLNTDRELVTY